MRRLITRAMLTAACISTLEGRTVGAQQPAMTVVASDSGATMQRVADGVYAIIHEQATEEWPHGNTGVIVGETGVLVIDSSYLPSRAVADIALIRRVTRLPVRYLVNTHWHGDHTHGNGVYRDAFPGLAILGPRASAGFIALNLLKLPRGSVAPNSYNRTALARLEALLTRGADTTGRALTDQEVRDLKKDIGERRNELTELAKVTVAPPTQIFEQALSIDLGTRRIEIRNMGWANSPADVIVYLPAERVLFTGDIVVYPAPYTSGASMLPWIGALEELEKYPVAALVPGHGSVLPNHDYTRLVRETFQMVRTQIDSMYREGVGLFDASKAVDISRMRERFYIPSLGRPVSVRYWEDFTRNIAQLMAECVHGYRC